MIRPQLLLLDRPLTPVMAPLLILRTHQVLTQLQILLSILRLTQLDPQLTRRHTSQRMIHPYIPPRIPAVALPTIQRQALLNILLIPHQEDHHTIQPMTRQPLQPKNQQFLLPPHRQRHLPLVLLTIQLMAQLSLRQLSMSHVSITETVTVDTLCVLRRENAVRVRTYALVMFAALIIPLCVRILQH